MARGKDWVVLRWTLTDKNRAGINFNDGFGGGDVIERNLVFSTCRESGDHGPFNVSILTSLFFNN